MLDYEFTIEQYGENHNEVRLDRLVRIVSAIARGSNVYSEEEFQLLYKEILDRLDAADALENEINESFEAAALEIEGDAQAYFI